MHQNKIASTNVASHKALNGIKKKGFDYFTLRPWNQYYPENSLWWLVPSQEWPSYKYGKIAIFKDKKSDDFNVGYHFEKGISKRASLSLASKNKAETYLTKPDWVWHIIIQDIRSGVFTEKISQISKSLNTPLRLIIHSSVVTGNSNNPDNSRGLNLESGIEFCFEDGAIKYIEETEQGEFYSYTDIKSLNGLIELFENETLDWSWLDFYIVTELSNTEITEITDLVVLFLNKYKEIFKREHVHS